MARLQYIWPRQALFAHAQKFGLKINFRVYFTREPELNGIVVIFNFLICLNFESCCFQGEKPSKPPRPTMNEQGAVPLNSKQALEHEQSSRPQFQTTKSFESVTIKPNSYTLDKPSQGAPRLPPTAMVAPLVGSIPSIARPLSSSTTTSPSCSPRHGLQRMNYGIETSLSSPSLDRVHEKASMSSPSKTQIQSLKTSLSERGQLIER